jgi:hypothetical protein
MHAVAEHLHQAHVQFAHVPLEAAAGWWAAVAGAVVAAPASRIQVVCETGSLWVVPQPMLAVLEAGLQQDASANRGTAGRVQPLAMLCHVSQTPLRCALHCQAAALGSPLAPLRSCREQGLTALWSKGCRCSLNDTLLA